MADNLVTLMNTSHSTLLALLEREISAVESEHSTELPILCCDPSVVIERVNTPQENILCDNSPSDCESSHDEQSIDAPNSDDEQFIDISEFGDEEYEPPSYEEEDESNSKMPNNIVIANKQLTDIYKQLEPLAKKSCSMTEYDVIKKNYIELCESLMQINIYDGKGKSTLIPLISVPLISVLINSIDGLIAIIDDRVEVIERENDTKKLLSLFEERNRNIIERGDESIKLLSLLDEKTVKVSYGSGYNHMPRLERNHMPEPTYKEIAEDLRLNETETNRLKSIIQRRMSRSEKIDRSSPCIPKDEYVPRYHEIDEDFRLECKNAKRDHISFLRDDEKTVLSNSQESVAEYRNQIDKNNVTHKDDKKSAFPYPHESIAEYRKRIHKYDVIHEDDSDNE